MPKVKTTKDPMDAVLANIEKQMGNKGKPIFSRFGDMQKRTDPAISFGIRAIDDASNCGGVPRGGLVEIFGPESSGKSLLSYYLISSAQKQGLECALIDIEQSFEAPWAAQHGIDISKLFYSNDFSSGEQALEYAYQLCKSGHFGVVVIDSTAALLPLSELEGNLEDNARIGEQARMLSRGCRKIVDACGRGNAICVFINQVRDKIGVMYGNPETTPGGKALRFYSHQRIRVTSKEKIKVKEGGIERIVGQISSVTFVKNKRAVPFGQAQFKIIFDPLAFNPVMMLCNALREAGIIGSYGGIFRIKKDILDNDKSMETGATTIKELAKYLINNKIVIPLLDKLIEAKEDDPSMTIDDSILDLKKNPDNISLPDEVKPSIEAEKISDATETDISEDIQGQETSPDNE